MTAYYNEHDRFAAAWLRELIKAGHIAPGEVDERSIEDVRPDDLKGFAQCHFFAGIGGWSYALRSAGWPDDKPVWTGSCPCQPFSAAGKGKGAADERHLWPAWFHLIAQCAPHVIFGEQVEAAINHGWLDLVQSDLEGEGYAVGAVGIPAAGVGAPHIRSRLWFVAESERQKRSGGNGYQLRTFGAPDSERKSNSIGQSSVSGELAESDGRNPGAEREQRLFAQRGRLGSVEYTPCEQVGLPRCAWFNGRPADWLPCRDGKARPVEPGTFPLAHGIPARVGRLRGYGNAIVPAVAAEVIRAYLDAELT